MKFYTIQTVEFWEKNKSNIYLENDTNYTWEDLVSPYKWMYSQMTKRIKDFDNSMIWVWTERPDLRRSGYLNKGEKGVLLEIGIDEEQVLLSDFEMWHNVLMDMPITIYDDEDIEKEKSWERIFDFDIGEKIYKEADKEFNRDIQDGKYANIKNFESMIVEVDDFEIIKQGVTSRVPLRNVKLIKTFTAR